MARPVMREPGGRWSLQQVGREAGVTDAVAKGVVRSGLLNQNRLTQDHVVLLRVAVALIASPTPFDGRSRVQHEEEIGRRNRRAMGTAAEMVRDRLTSGYLIVFPDESMAVEDDLDLTRAIRKRPTSPALVLPIGAWITDLIPATEVAS